MGHAVGRGWQARKLRRPYSWRCRIRRSPFLPLGYARGRSAERRILVQSTPCGVGASGETRAPFGAPSRRHSGAGPHFLTRRFALPPALSTLAPFGRPCLRASGKPDGPPSASSSQGVVVPPGGAPVPPECRRSVRLLPAGAASCSIIKTPLDDALE